MNVVAKVERSGVTCSCGEPMTPEEGRWVDTTASVFARRPPFPKVSDERLVWWRCPGCGAITEATLLA